MRSGRRLVLGAIVSVAALSVAACGSSSSSSTSATGGAAASTSSTAATTAASNPSLKGAPIVVAGWAPIGTAEFDLTSNEAMMNAAVDGVNARGGIGGRPLKLDFCNVGIDPNTATQCAQQAITEKAVAVVGSYNINTNATAPILQKAGIPSIAPGCCGSADYSNPISFPLQPSNDTEWIAMANLAKQGGCTAVSFLVPQIATAGVISAEAKKAFVANGLKVAAYVSYPAETADFAPVVAKTLQGSPDCVVFTTFPAQIAPISAALSQQGAKVKVVVGAGELPAGIVAKTGGASSPLEGALIPAPSPPASSPVWAQFNADITKYAPNGGINPNDYTAQGAWLAVQTVAKVGGTLGGNVTSQSFLAALNKTSSLNLGGMLPTLNLSKPRSIPNHEREFNTYVWWQTIKNGEFTTFGPGGFTNALTGLQQYGG